LIYQWLDEHPHFLFQDCEKENESDKPMSRAEIAEYLGISKVTVTDWMKKGLPYRDSISLIWEGNHRIIISKIIVKTFRL